LLFLQKQFKNREAEKNYITLATGVIKKDHEEIRTLIGRSPADPRKQKAHPIENPKSEIINPRQIQNIKSQNSRIRREAVTGYKVLRRYDKYTLLEAYPKTGRKHQIRCHMAYIHHPIAGDKLYGFKDSPTPEGLKRHFLHATYLKIQLPSGETKEFKSELPEELAKIIQNLKIKNQNDN
jgi:23S rRNA pseudouridine1911/1915/1917 synthase